MNTLAYIALLGLTSAQDLEWCTTSEECPADKYGETGCCSRMTFVSFAEEPVWGGIVNVLSQTGDEADIVPGGYNEFCINGEFREAADAEMAEFGEIVNTNDIEMFLEANPDVAEAMGGTDPQFFIDAMGSDAQTNDEFILTRQCVEDLASEEGAKMLFAATMTVGAAIAASL